jgi:hypothetical protein
MIDQILHTPKYITDLPAVMTLGRIAVENPKKGERKTKDASVVHYFHYSKGQWCVRYYMHPAKELGCVLLTYDQQEMMEAKGHVAMSNAMEMIDHWIKTKYVPKITDYCSADYSPAIRYKSAHNTGKGTKPFIS